MSGGLVRAVRGFTPGLAALARYDRSWLKYDLAAGVSVAAVAVPVAIAYSQLAGVPPVYGLYASILPLVAYAIFGTSRQLIMAPDAATCAIVATVVIPLAAGDTSRQISLTVALSMITGLFCIAAGLLRLGFLTNFLARPILTGYINGIAIAIISGQLGKMFGFSMKPAGFFRTMAEFVTKVDETHWPTLAVAATVFVLLRAFRRWAPQVPGPLIGVGLGIAAGAFLRLDEHGVALLGAVPAGLPHLMIPRVGLSDLEPLAAGAIGLALISFNSAMVTGRGFAVKNRYELDPNQEFIALGMSDIGAGVLQGFAISGADSRTAVNDSAGGKSQVTGLVVTGLIVLVLLFLTGPLASLPIAVLSAVLVSSSVGLFDLPEMARLRRISPQEFRLSIVTLLGVITVGVLPGVGVAVGLAIIQLLMKASRPHDAILGRVPEGEGFQDIESRPDAETVPGIVVFRFDAALLFFNADHFRARVRKVLEEAGAGLRCFVLDAEAIPGIDSTGAAVLGELHRELSERGIAFAVADVRKPLRDMFERTGFTQQIGPEMCFRRLDAAMARLEPEYRGSAPPVGDQIPEDTE